MMADTMGGRYSDWISNLTDEAIERHLYCYQCRSHISGTYWYINEEVLCDDCAKSIYQRGIDDELSEYEGL